jgi:Wiskott-Aldrich syndrome protein
MFTLDENENAKVKTAVPTSSSKIYYTARARIYFAHASTRQWHYAGLQGALAFVLNTSSNTLHFKLVDLDGTGGVIWDYELYDGLVLDQEKSASFFISFEGRARGNVRYWFNIQVSYLYSRRCQEISDWFCLPR